MTVTAHRRLCCGACVVEDRPSHLSFSLLPVLHSLSAHVMVSIVSAAAVSAIDRGRGRRGKTSEVDCTGRRIVGSREKLLAITSSAEEAWLGERGIHYSGSSQRESRALAKCGLTENSFRP